MLIAIDGTSSSGKSTISRMLGSKLNINVLGAGSLYRALALKMINLSINEKQIDRIEVMLETTVVDSQFNNGITDIYVDGIKQNMDELNSHEVSVFVPKVAQIPIVREFVRKIQKSQAEKFDNIIFEGRDIGSVVFPNADIKLFIDADIKSRALRRLNDYTKNGKNYTLNQVIKEIQERDDQDRKRDISPLIMTSDAHIIDTSDLTAEQSVDYIIKIIEETKK